MTTSKSGGRAVIISTDRGTGRVDVAVVSRDSPPALIGSIFTAGARSRAVGATGAQLGDFVSPRKAAKRLLEEPVGIAACKGAGKPSGDR